MLRNPSRDNLSNIWPSAGSAFCVIHQKNGAFIAQALPSQNPSGYQKSRDALPRRVIEVKAAVAGLICNNKLLLCLEDHGRLRHKQLSSYTINLTTSGEWELVSERHPHSKLDRDIDTSAGMAKHVSSDRVELILYSTKKKILRYTLPTS